MVEIKFSCPYCGQHIQCDQSWFGRKIRCPSCRRIFTTPQAPAVAPGREPGILTARLPPPGSAPTEGGVGTSGWARASLVLSLLGLVTGVTALGGIVCGHVAKAHLKRDPTLTGKSQATAGLVIGYIIVAVIVLGTLAFLLLPRSTWGGR